MLLLVVAKYWAQSFAISAAFAAIYASISSILAFRSSIARAIRSSISFAVRFLMIIAPAAMLALRALIWAHNLVDDDPAP